VSRQIHKALYKVYNLPDSYFGIGYKDTKLSAARQEVIAGKIENVPSKGTLVIQGTAAPVVNQLLTTDKKIRGICFTERSQSAFETYQNPAANIIVLYDVGMEVTLNSKVSGMVLNSILKHYSGRNTLVIIETHLTKTELLSKYDLNVVNFIKIELKAQEAWI
jgi:hypothetical protein